MKQLGARPVADYYSDSDELRDWAHDHKRHIVEFYQGLGVIRNKHDGQPKPMSIIETKLCDRAGGDPAEWPEDLRVREFPKAGGGS